MIRNSVTVPDAAPRAPALKLTLSPSEGWATVFLAAVLVLVTVACIESLAWTPGIGILTLTTLMGMLLGFVLAKQSWLPQWLAEIPAQAIGIFFAFYETAVVSFQGNLRVMASHLGTWAQQVAAGQSSSDNAIFLLFLAVLTMLLGYVSMWLIFRSRSAWLAVIANAIVLLINLNYAFDDKSFFAILFMLVALLLLVRCNLVERMRLWRRKGLRFAPEIGWDFMQAGIIFAILVMLASVFLPSNYVNGQLSAVWNSPTGPWARVQNRFAQIFKINNAGSGPTSVGFGKSLNIQGDVNLPDTPVLAYTTTDTTGAYFLGLTYDLFDGHTWDTTTKGQLTQKFGANPAQPPLPETTVDAKVTTNVTVLSVPQGNYLYALGEPSAFSIPFIAQSDGIPLTAGDQIGSYTDWQLQHTMTSNTSFQTASYVSTATEAQLQAVPAPQADPTQYPPGLLARYTALPKDLSDKNNEVNTTALVWTAGTTSMYDALQAIIEHFRTGGYRYSTTNPDPDPNKDAAMALLDTKQGYCTFYATTMVMMARELGFPARMAVGFINGAQELKNGQPTGRLVVVGSDAHAWVQVYFPGYGWINFEASVGQNGFPESVRAASGSGGTGSSSPDKLPKIPQRTETAVATPPSTTGTVAPVGTTKPSVGTPINPVVRTAAVSSTVLLIILLLVALLVAVWWRAIYRGLSPIGQTFARMTLLSRLGGVRAQPAQTATEYGELLASRLPDQRTAIEEITELYVRERWSPEPTPADGQFATRWRTLRNQLLRRLPSGVARRLRRPRGWPKR